MNKGPDSHINMLNCVLPILANNVRESKAVQCVALL
jgi:hypothetical protein